LTPGREPDTLGDSISNPNKKHKYTYMKTLLTSLFCAALVAGFSSGAFAQATRTWVSGVGDDANPCSRTAPCKTFAGAISKTADKGEISVLDPGGFGVVTIVKGITINGTGTLAGILSAGSPSAITVNDVNAAVPNSSVVIIRDVSMNGAGTGTSGVRYLSGKTVMLDHCWIYGMTSRGIDVSKTSSGNLKVLNTVIENCGEDGIHMTTTANQILATVNNTDIMNCAGDGIEGVTNVLLALVNTRVTHNGNGVRSSGAGCQFNIDDIFVSYSGVGLQASTGSTFRVSDSIIAQNATGISQNSGVIDSFQGNSLMGNTTPGAFSSTTNKQ
jgi:hypothetical protein